ncbi:hypothetical protein WBP06_13915 [Novosphingobium sp. BL-8H]|uniref:hypothetical protein n=1 Tax=Novosphingobium sp. BL-8H TaxID=3127640 RepID=UPI0037567346
MYHAAIAFPPDRSAQTCRAHLSRPPSTAWAEHHAIRPDDGIDLGRRYPLLGLALATGVSALCWAGLAALVL